MADQVTVQISGLEELQKALEQLADKTGTQTVRAAARAGGTVIKNEMVLQAPHGETNTLADPKNFTVGTRKQTGEPLAVTALIGPNNRKIIYPRTVGKTKGIPRTAAFISKLLEFGSATRSAKKAFITAAFEVSKNKAVDRVIEVLKEKLNL